MELYVGNDNQFHFVQTSLLSDFGSFKYKTRKSIDQVSKRYNHLLSRLMKYDLERSLIEKKVKFLQGLRSEWKSIVLTVKAHEQFKTYKLLQVIGI